MITMATSREASPFPWRSHVNFDGAGGCRMIDAKGVEVALLSVMALSGIVTATIAAQPAATQKEGAAA
ncbi:MAG: hypothetical protein V4793_15945 [Paraburkholderia tropica]|uniref:Uncharacterized protein n=1 Tax=Paraburkholderia tropica TaxID=92647 RepID=A0ABX5MC32_9BURK|nr:hypothetical protein [Paraburkholderia tropica]MBB3004688.1 hypothetical protein [Paraburkholderia tropica]MBB6323486.1 hypothetical protein [Paraburkholderia tropica]PXX03452.1 hypothetical protein C7400_1493 [Paraburkholderia tropica]PZW69371.1 hypothetical protein C7399_1493 [Paraburkholderia tropica]QNB17387.1 hypothetical protein G5S35_37940 [Paraburkholderia tropica]